MFKNTLLVIQAGVLSLAPLGTKPDLTWLNRKERDILILCFCLISLTEEDYSRLCQYSLYAGVEAPSSEVFLSEA